MAGLYSDAELGVPIGQASWRHMGFVHLPFRPADVQALLPQPLTVDTYRDRAWVSLTPFRMVHVRPAGPSPRAPRGWSLWPRFNETNLRTYVRGPHGRDGVWFLSLAATWAPFVPAARLAVGAPYHHARLTISREHHGGDDGRVVYAGRRSRGEQAYRIQLRVGALLRQSAFDVWLTGRWRAYTRRGRRLLVTPLTHEPWTLARAAVETLDQNLTDWAGLPPAQGQPVAHVAHAVEHVQLGMPRTAAALAATSPGGTSDVAGP